MYKLSRMFRQSLFFRPLPEYIFLKASFKQPYSFLHNIMQRLDYQVDSSGPAVTVPLCPFLHGNAVASTWHPDHAAAETQMNASLWRLPGGARRGFPVPTAGALLEEKGYIQFTS